MARQHRLAAGFLSGFVLIALVHLLAQLLPAPSLASVSQSLLMPALAGYLLAACARGKVRTGVLVALGFSWLGDTLPQFVAQDCAFLVMVAGFLLAQITYILVFRGWVLRAWRGGRRRGLAVAAGCYGLLGVGLCVVIVPHAQLLAAPVLAYALVLVVMATAAVVVHPLAAVGAALFVFSDALIGLNAFAPGYYLPGQGFWVMATYIAAQTALILGIRARVIAGRGRSSTNGPARTGPG